MAWTDAEKRAIQNLVLRIENLEKKVSDLQDCCNNATCSCDCKVYPHIVEIPLDYYYFDENGNEVAKTAEELGITHDRFPEPACSGEVGILIMNDVWIICQYHTQDGWIIKSSNKR